MKHTYCYILILCMTFMFIPWESCAVNKSDSIKIAALKNKLKHNISQAEKMATIYQLSRFYRDDASERDYSKKLYDIALSIDSIEKAEYAIINLTRYYYNKNNKDSVTYWSEKAKALYTTKDKHSDLYFKICNMACQFNLWYDPDEEMANEALRLYHLAHKENNPVGIYSSCETLGVAYCVMGQDSLAVQYYIEGMNIVETTKPFGYSNLHSLLELTLESLFNLKEADSVEKYIIKYEKLTEDVSNGKYGTRKYPVDRCRWLSHLFRAHFYILKGKLNEAQHQLNIGQIYSQKVEDIYCIYLQHLVYVHYYKAKKEYNKALKEMEVVLSYGSNTDLYNMKGELLMLDGKYKESAECYKQAIASTKKNNNDMFMRQMNQLAHMHDINQAKEAHNDEVFKRKQLQLLVILSITCFTLILLVLSIVYTLHHAR